MGEVNGEAKSVLMKIWKQRAGGDNGEFMLKQMAIFVARTC